MFDVLSIKQLYGKVSIIWVVENLGNWVYCANIKNKKELREYNARMGFYKKCFGQKFVNYIGAR